MPSPMPGGNPLSPLSTTRKMPSPMASPALRPASPMSPRQSHFDTLQPPSQRPLHPRANSSTQRRSQNNALRLPGLPRFHPANFPSSHSSAQSTPDASSNTSSPHAPVSPRTHQRMHSGAQRQLYFNHRELFSAGLRATSPSQAGKPVSPRLQPLGSPGPITPLELERDEGYLVAGARSNANSTTSSDELVESLIRAEVQRQQPANPQSRPTAR